MPKEETKIETSTPKRFYVQYRETNGAKKSRILHSFFNAVDQADAETQFWQTPIWKPPIKKIEIVSIETV